MAERLRITGVVQNVVFQNEETGFCVLELAVNQDTVTVVGELAGAAPGEELTLTGEFSEHPSFGSQFKADSCEYRLPEGEYAVRQYLSSGVLPGIGPATAKRIVDAFGAETLDILQTSPEKLAQVQGFSAQKARRAGEEFCRIIGLREAVNYLGSLGVGVAAAMNAYRAFGPDTVELVRANPFLLCGAPLYLPFGQADDAAARLELDPESEERMQAGALYVLRHNLNNGHTCLPRAKLVSTAAAFLRVEKEQMDRCLGRMTDDARLMSQMSGEQEFLYLPEYFRAEFYIAARLRELMRFPLAVPGGMAKSIDLLQQVQGVTYASLQRTAIETALSCDAMVLTGGPGTGKTTTLNAVLALLEQQDLRVGLAAPTGRAAKRLGELTGRKARTIHRLLEVDYRTGTDEIRFIHNENNLLKYDAVIVDEMSMVDTLLFESLLRALKPNCRLVLVGDSDQLPSVGAGNVLKSIADSGVVPLIRLTEIFRQAASSLIVSNAHRIVRGELPQPGARTDDYFFLQADGTTGQALVCDLVGRRLPASYGFNGWDNIQVLCPTKLGPLGTEQLNRTLQQLLNPPAREKAQLERMGVTYRRGDKVMQTRNNYDIRFERDGGEEGAGAFNGDIGVISGVDRRAGTLEVRFDDRLYKYEGDEIQQLELAYAVTVHKSQGSEFDAVVLPLAEVPPKLCYRNLLYTAVTRAKKLLIVVGDGRTLAAMVANDRKILRYSCLTALLKDDSLA